MKKAQHTVLYVSIYELAGDKVLRQISHPHTAKIEVEQSRRTFTEAVKIPGVPYLIINLL